ncbi:hypothetical protein QTI66_06210 [Variovorax sp. J22R133]|uniref:hypothetical protein n=1 Tax=Variovorax brevis TaxID=3053503 RepID=UPI00257613B3|nr:hypothetical protein [Variovorax sp. J22R133]MDM0111735.1 hypothetical protein [Variovorax sp. J22R133]
MNTYAPLLRPLLLAVALSGAMACAHAVVNPPIRMAPQGIEYMCGGTGKDEAAFMEMVSPRWAATLEFAVNQDKGSAAAAGVKVRVRNSYNGDAVMEVMADAPYMLARLDPGSYVVEATLDGLTLIQPLHVFAGQASRAVFVWPSNLSAPTQTQAAL